MGGCRRANKRHNADYARSVGHSDKGSGGDNTNALSGKVSVEFISLKILTIFSPSGSIAINN